MNRTFNKKIYPYGILGLACALFASPTNAQPHADLPLRSPLFSIDATSPSVGPTVPHNAVLKKPGPQIAFAITGVNNPNDELDGVSGSYNLEHTQEFLVLFSVDKASTGGTSADPVLVGANRPFNVQHQAMRNQAAADIYMSTSPFTRMGPSESPTVRTSPNNTLVRNQGDAGGGDLDLKPEIAPEEDFPPATPIDEADSIGYAGASSSLEAGVPINNVFYFSLTKTSPALNSLPGPPPPSGTSIYRVDPNQPGATPTFFVGAQQLGLIPGTGGDDIDDFIVFSTGGQTFIQGQDQVVFSLSRGSPSLAGASPANLYTSNGNNAFTIFAQAGTLGLATNDNIDGLDLVTTDDPDTTIFQLAIQQKLPGDYDANGILDESDCEAFGLCYRGQDLPYDTDGANMVNVTLGPSHFSPPVVTIEPGDTVRWMWTGGTHNVTSGSSGAPDGMFYSGPPTSVVGTTYQVTFSYALLDVYPRVEWVYPYYCQSHPLATGTVNVDADPCAVFDLDFDLDVDCADWVKFQNIYSQYSALGKCPPLTIPEFVAALLGTPILPVHTCRADMNLDGKADGRDVAPYVDTLVP